jgi:adenosylcobinamide kinase/adenosylcobinamide-phosphate guanylyltransferase
MGIVFITGGARSGKSVYALSRAQMLSGEKAFIATAQALDDEMKIRIEAHKKERGNTFDTYEEPIKIAELVETLKHRYDVMLIDCLTLWLSNVMYAGLRVEGEVNNLINVINVGADLRVCPESEGQSHRIVPTERLYGVSPTIFIVSNEVGMGIVPENRLARQFRDYQGILNQHIASIADEVYMLIAGISVKIK